jgi:hypothetical protein
MITTRVSDEFFVYLTIFLFNSPNKTLDGQLLHHGKTTSDPDEKGIVYHSTKISNQNTTLVQKQSIAQNLQEAFLQSNESRDDDPKILPPK